MFYRIIFSFILFLSLFFVPWWLTVVIAALLIIRFEYFWESLLTLFIIDLLYAVPESHFFNLYFLLTLLGLFLFVGVESVRGIFWSHSRPLASF